MAKRKPDILLVLGTPIRNSNNTILGEHIAVIKDGMLGDMPACSEGLCLASSVALMYTREQTYQDIYK